MASSAQYDIVLLGATGYTGLITAEYLHQNIPTHFKWAIAGRSESKLKNINSTLAKLDSKRTTPDILTVNLNTAELVVLAKKTRVIINCIGPYTLYSTPVVQACAETGTHYLDVTGETPWVREVLRKYESTAQKSGAIIIPECGVESAPSDMLAYVATKLVRDVWDCGVMDMVGSIHELKSNGVSGGTLASGLTILDHYGVRAVRECFGNPFCLSPIEERDHRHTKHPEPISYERTIWQKLFGVWEYPFLGTLTTSITAAPNVAIVQRSAGINQVFYSYNFTYEEYMRVSSPLIGYIIHFALAFISAAMIIPPVRALARMFATAPGSGPARENQNGVFEIRGVAVAEQLNKKQRKALASVRFEGGGAYDYTALLVAEAAMSLLEGVEDLQKKFGPGGFLTPSCLGDRYVRRLEEAGVKISVKQLGEVGSK